MDQITILMAVYNPDKEWFKEQLSSLNQQTYPKVKLLICNDASPDISEKELEEFINKYVDNIQWKLISNIENKGSTKTFERLTLEADGDYFAYCDQDDIWNKDKLYKELEYLKSNKACMVCCNADAIDTVGKILTKSYMCITDAEKEKIENNTIWKELLIRNCFWGCTMLISSDSARNSLPFCKNMYHDHYLALYASIQGRICFVDKALMQYRIHGDNQTGFLKDANDKKSYIKNRILPLRARYEMLLKKQLPEEYKAEIENVLKWVKSREEYAQGKWSRMFDMLRTGININRKTTMFESMTLWLPERLWKWQIEWLKQNKGK